MIAFLKIKMRRPFFVLFSFKYSMVVICFLCLRFQFTLNWQSSGRLGDKLISGTGDWPVPVECIVAFNISWNLLVFLLHFRLTYFMDFTTFQFQIMSLQKDTAIFVAFSLIFPPFRSSQIVFAVEQILLRCTANG